MNTETSTSFLTDTTGNRLRSVRYALEVLGFDVDGDIPAEAEVSKRVKELARANHPDIVAGRGGDVAEATAVFALVNAGADILADAGCRLDWAKRVEIRAEMPAEELSGQFCWNHAADGHAADGHATDGHATDGHATDGHATDGMSARAAANAEANAAANAAAAERVTPLVGFLAGLHACVRTATGRRQGAEAALAATEAMRSPFGRRIPAHRAGWRALGALLPAIAAVLVPRLAAITDTHWSSPLDADAHGLGPGDASVGFLASVSPGQVVVAGMLFVVAAAAVLAPRHTVGPDAGGNRIAHLWSTPTLGAVRLLGAGRARLVRIAAVTGASWYLTPAAAGEFTAPWRAAFLAAVVMSGIIAVAAPVVDRPLRYAIDVVTAPFRLVFRLLGAFAR